MLEYLNVKFLPLAILKIMPLLHLLEFKNCVELMEFPCEFGNEGAIPALEAHLVGGCGVVGGAEAGGALLGGADVVYCVVVVCDGRVLCCLIFTWNFGLFVCLRTCMRVCVFSRDIAGL